MGMNSFAPFLKEFNRFVVKNIASPPKTVRIFNYPIPTDMTRDLLAIEGVSASEIAASLLKGEILHKLRYKEITILDSDIDLLQFNTDNLQFLQSSGITNGLQVGPNNFQFSWKQDIQLVGSVNDVNTIFTIPSGHFIQDVNHKIIVYKNGVKQAYLDDYIISESGGIGTGYDTVIFYIPPATTPTPIDIVTADYYIAN
jgi:hypothetical protein